MARSNRHKAISEIKQAEIEIDRATRRLKKAAAIYTENYPSIAYPILVCIENLELIRGELSEDNIVLFQLLENWLTLIKEVLPNIRDNI